ncbi:antitoxin [Aestuariimicrobium sp. p3-SID1156]|uniref:antitoxin n=1 Tax=Aestuariimicrobium sp. p3-SID1156 TaxID=2916038 RepID=UPI00223ACC38|nr:antitoxin [Aestuariimicrobium sp. p3-SID1156]MCT1459093.1 antitoxin [Aestuariimicrobium sp. p3-SID1156]
MGIMDSVKDAFNDGENNDHIERAKDVANQHEDKIDAGVDRAGDLLDDRTGGRFESHVDKGQDVIQDKTGNL